MGSERLLIVPWLVEKLNSQEYPGVSWLNPERTQFRVPWKHKSRQNIVSEDFQIFEDWAIVRGHYHPGRDPPAPSDWKRNFRAALNRKKEIVMVQDNSTDSNDPHKVFEIQFNIPNPNDAAVGAVNTGPDDPVSAGSMDTFTSHFSFSPDETLESVLSALDLSSSHEGAENTTWGGSLSLTNPHLNLTLPTIVAPPSEPVLGTSIYENPVCCEDQPLASLNQVTVPPLEQIFGSTAFETDFEVRVYYRGRLFSTNVFSNTCGLCFVPPGSSGHYPDLQDVVLPDPSALCDKLQMSFTQRILHGVAPGVLLRIEGKSLCGMRRGHCHVFWGQSEIATENTFYGQLPKEQFCPVYSVSQFVQELTGYMEGKNSSPKYTLWLCFGEDWPDTQRPWKKKLIMVEVIPKAFQFLHELSQIHGASSLKENNPDLRISNSPQQPSFLDQLREWEEKMDIVQQPANPAVFPSNP